MPEIKYGRDGIGLKKGNWLCGLLMHGQFHWMGNPWHYRASENHCDFWIKWKKARCTKIVVASVVFVIFQLYWMALSFSSSSLTLSSICEKVNDFLSLFPDFVIHDSNLFSMNNRTINVCNVESSSEGKKSEFQRQKRENVSRFWPILDTIHPNEIVYFLSFV